MESTASRPSPDATAHAEVQAIRAAAPGLGTHELTGCVLYCFCGVPDVPGRGAVGASVAGWWRPGTATTLKPRGLTIQPSTRS